jgi:hypothetical protein
MVLPTTRIILLLSASILFASEHAHAFSVVGLGLPLSSTSAASASSSRLRATQRPGGALSSVRASVPGISYGQLQHCGVLVDDVKTAVDFYVNVLGMKDVSELRPAKLDYPGAFLACGKDQIHLMKVRDRPRWSAGCAFSWCACLEMPQHIFGYR